MNRRSPEREWPLTWVSPRPTSSHLPRVEFLKGRIHGPPTAPLILCHLTPHWSSFYPGPQVASAGGYPSYARRTRGEFLYWTNIELAPQRTRGLCQLILLCFPWLTESLVVREVQWKNRWIWKWSPRTEGLYPFPCLPCRQSLFLLVFHCILHFHQVKLCDVYFMDSGPFWWTKTAGSGKRVPHGIKGGSLEFKNPDRATVEWNPLGWMERFGGHIWWEGLG